MSLGTSSPIDPSMYSTPPSTPSVFKQMQQQGSSQQSAQAALARRSSRPHMINISRSQGPPVQLAIDSPVASTLSPPAGQTHQNAATSSSDPSSAAMSSEDAGAATVTGDHHGPSPGIMPKSPCFVHSLLDKGASLTDWLKTSNHGPSAHDEKTKNRDDSQRSVSRHGSSTSYTGSPTPSESSHSLGFQTSSPTEYDEEEDGAASLTRQLAATAVGVREMSKQLGRARVRSNIQNVMIITKARDNRLIQLTRDLALYLMAKRCQGGRGMIVYVDHQLRTSKRFDAAGIERDFPDYFRPQPRRFSSTSSYSMGSTTDSESVNGNAPKDEGQLRYWTTDMCSKSPHLFDFVITLGGDGTVLFTSWLFQTIVPPVLPFALGSLGFLTNFDFADHQKVVDNVIEKGIRVNLRMRFTCTVYRSVKPEEERGGKRRRCIKKGDTGQIFMKNLEEGGWERLEGNPNAPAVVSQPTTTHRSKDKDIMCFTTRPVESFEVINDLVVDRGPSPYVSLLELFGDEHHLTTVQADGLCISTPTGSTAYSLSAGGSLVHPEIPAILISPICPHTLSFRPMLLPDSMELRICVPYNSRSTAWASFDGRGRVELKQGDHIKVTASKFPFPTVCAENQSVDWFKSISRTLKWNERERQKSFVVVEEDPDAPKKKRKSRRMLDATPSANDRLKVMQASQDGPNVDGDIGQDDEEDEDDDDDEEEEEEEKYDIDDSSPEAVAAATQASAADTANTTPQKQQPPPVVKEPPSSSSEEVIKPTSYAARQAALALGAGGAISGQGHGSGIDSPSRFAGDVPHPPKVHSRHLLAEHGRPPAPHHHQSHHHQQPADQSQQLSPQVPTTSASDNIPTPRPQDRAHPPFDSSGATGSSPSSAKHRGVWGQAKRIVSDT
ncbi:hypothetical protein FRC01_005384, partial [Tulasnella sp. 417]